MDEMEKLLKEISLMKPTADLRQRIFDEQARPSGFAGIFARRISLGWAAVLALFVGLAGYALAHLSTSQIIQPSMPVGTGVDVQIVEGCFRCFRRRRDQVHLLLNRLGPVGSLAALEKIYQLLIKGGLGGNDGFTVKGGVHIGLGDVLFFKLLFQQGKNNLA